MPQPEAYSLEHYLGKLIDLLGDLAKEVKIDSPPLPEFCRLQPGGHGPHPSRKEHASEDYLHPPAVSAIQLGSNQVYLLEKFLGRCKSFLGSPVYKPLWESTACPRPEEIVTGEVFFVMSTFPHPLLEIFLQTAVLAESRLTSGSGEELEDRG